MRPILTLYGYLCHVTNFLTILNEHIAEGTLVRLTLSKPLYKTQDLKNVYIRPLEIKGKPMYSFTYRHSTNDVVKNFDAEGCKAQVAQLIPASFQIATLLSTHEEVILRIAKKGSQQVSRKKTIAEVVSDKSHDRLKHGFADLSDVYLKHLKVTDQDGNLIPRMADKFKQINKYLEIVDGLIKSVPLPANIHIADMGSGKGYLTFALYNYLVNKLHLNVEVTGVEQRPNLVALGNEVASQCGFTKLNFIESTIQDYKTNKIDILIALHACDTATDEAIAKGIKSNASIIICAPCCHKQIRQQVKGKIQSSPLLKYGIFKERQFEMVTDTLRALLLELHGYKANIFEFISSEHTNKNIMLVGTRSAQPPDVKEIRHKIDSLKESFQIEYHFLEKLL